MIDHWRRLCQLTRLTRFWNFHLHRLLALSLVVTPVAPALAQSPSADSARQEMSCVAAEADRPQVRAQRDPNAPLQIDSENFEAPPGAPIRFSENVRVEMGDQRLDTGELIYNRETGRIDLPVLLYYSDAFISLSATSGWVLSEDSRARFENVDYRLSGGEGSGSAGQVEMTSDSSARVRTFTFTTCDPSRPDWQLESGQVRLDMERGVGVARNARLDFFGVPILYSPWLSFPLNDERKSGFLYPGIGFSTDDGFDLSVPWYWNIAPNQDATLTPRFIQDRGAMLMAEYRFLTPRQRGQIDVEFLPEDRETDSRRYFAQLGYRARLAPRWSASVNLRRASDDDYFVDLGGDLEESAVQFLRSVATVRGTGRFWSASLLADDFQVLDESVRPSNEPYSRLPRMRFDVDLPLAAGFDFALDSELVYFERDTGVTGGRLDMLPRLRYSLLAPGWFLRPELGLRSTAYALDVDSDSTLTRTTPIASLDAGMVFERRLASGRLQTLEPRLFYLYVPNEDQDELPVFDTRELTFGFSQLFHYNRFSGPDRQGDANQLTVALTSRLLDADDGRSVLDVNLGQIFYFRDLSVQMPNRPEQSRSASATVAEVNWRPAGAVLASAGLEWDPEENETQVGRLGLSYRGESGRQAALSYRFRRDRVDQLDFRWRLPLRHDLNLIGRVNYSFEDEELLEVLGGIEYESCCWAVRLMGREYIRDRESETRTAVFLELHLKGLGSLGRRPYPLFPRYGF